MISASPRALRVGAAAAALLLAGTAGYGLARLTTRPTAVAAPAAEAHDEHEAAGDAVTLTAAQISAAGIRTEPVGRGGGGQIRLVGQVEAMAGARSPIAASVQGRIETLSLSTGQSVRAGQVVAVLVSAAGATLSADADADTAAAAAEVARATWRRDAALHRQGWIAAQRLDITRAELLRAEALVRAARARVTAAGGPSATGRINVISPITGVVTAVSGSRGSFVAEGATMAEVSDPAQVELIFRAPPAVAVALQPGRPIRAESGGRTFEAVVVAVAADVSETNSGSLVRARAVNGAPPPAGSAVTGEVVIEPSAGRLTVPTAAVQTLEGRPVVFVATASGFRAVPVLPGRQASGRTEILRGLSGTERIASAGAFLLRSELARGDAEHGH